MSNNDATLDFAQAYLDYSDEQMDFFKNNPRNMEILPKMAQLMNTDFIFEVVDAHGCLCQHKAGQKIIINGDNSISKNQGPEKVCIYLLHTLTMIIFSAQELIYAGLDPNQIKFKKLGCFDTGVKCGGVGNVIVEFSSNNKST